MAVTEKIRTKATCVDVARLAGVHVATVSRVVNNKTTVGTELRVKVLDAANKLNYKPSIAARMLVSQKYETIGLITETESESAYYGLRLLQGITLRLSTQQLRLLLGMVEWGSKIQDVLELPIVSTHSVDGYIFDLIKLDGDIANLQSQIDVPSVFVNPNVVMPFNSIIPDDILLAKETTEYLIKRGHKNIGYIPSVVTNSHISQSNRMKGYISALSNSGLSALPLWDKPLEKGSDVKFGPEDEYVTRVKILTEKYGCTAFVTYSALEGCRLINACSEIGIKIPKNVSVISCDYDPVVRGIRTKLTCMSLDRLIIGEMAIDMLQKRVRNHGKDEPSISVKGTLIEGESVAVRFE